MQNMLPYPRFFTPFLPVNFSILTYCACVSFLHTIRWMQDFRIEAHRSLSLSSLSLFNPSPLAYAIHMASDIMTCLMLLTAINKTALYSHTTLAHFSPTHTDTNRMDVWCERRFTHTQTGDDPVCKTDRYFPPVCQLISCPPPPLPILSFLSSSSSSCQKFLLAVLCVCLCVILSFDTYSLSCDFRETLPVHSHSRRGWCVCGGIIIIVSVIIMIFMIVTHTATNLCETLCDISTSFSFSALHTSYTPHKPVQVLAAQNTNPCSENPAQKKS